MKIESSDLDTKSETPVKHPIGEGNGNPLQCSCLENPRDGGPGGLPSMGSHRVGHDRVTSLSRIGEEMATHSSVLAWRIPGMGGLVGCRLWGRTESDTTEVT